MASGIPQGYHSIQSYLICRNAAEAIAFYVNVFGGVESTRALAPDGTRIMHAEIRIGDSVLMLCDEFPESGALSPQPGQGGACSMYHFTDDVDALFHRAVIAGSDVKMPPQDMFWGDRACRFMDPFGHFWTVATRYEKLHPDEVTRRANAFFSQQQQQQQ